MMPDGDPARTPPRKQGASTAPTSTTLRLSPPPPASPQQQLVAQQTAYSPPVLQPQEQPYISTAAMPTMYPATVSTINMADLRRGIEWWVHKERLRGHTRPHMQMLHGLPIGLQVRVTYWLATLPPTGRRVHAP